MTEKSKGKKSRKGLAFIFILAVIGIVLFLVSGIVYPENMTNNTSNDNATATGNIAKPVAGLYPQAQQSDIALQTNYISDNLYAGTTYTYKVQVKNIGEKDVTIEPRLSAGYPYVYPMAATASGSTSSSSGAEVSNSVLNNTSVPASAPVPAPTPVPVSAGVATNSAMPNMVAGSGVNGQAFDNDAVNVSAPSTIGAGEVVNMTIVVTVPENATGYYYTSIDMNVNNVENDPNNPQLSLSFSVMQPVTTPFVKKFSLDVDQPIQIDLTADNYNSNMNTRVSPAMQDPSFNVTLTSDGEPVNLTLVKTDETGNVGMGSVQYPMFSSSNLPIYQDYGTHYVKTYTMYGTVGDYELSILPENINNFGYTITLGNVPVR